MAALRWTRAADAWSSDPHFPRTGALRFIRGWQVRDAGPLADGPRHL